MALSISAIIAGYCLLPANDQQKIVNNKSKKFVLIVVAVAVMLFMAAMGASIFTVKLF